MNRQLTAHSRLQNLRKEAKRWLKALHAQDKEAHERLRRSWPGAPAEPTLRDLQHALAREHGAMSWAALKDALAEASVAEGTLGGRSHDERTAEFLEHACLRYGVRPGTGKWEESYYDDPSRWRYAARILKKHPEIVKGNIHAAAVSGDLPEVERILRSRPAAASERAALDGQQPLRYVCYGRLPVSAASENAVAIASALLDAGAPYQVPLTDNAGAEFQPLTGAIGAGEAGQPPHPQAVPLAVLLIDRGADPYDAQALYNLSLAGDDLFWYDFLYERSAQRGETHKWTQPSSGWPRSPMVQFLLNMAVHGNHPKRARWALSHGADPRDRHSNYSPGDLHTHAVINGYAQIADLLLQFGAVAGELNGQQAFQAACVRLDRETAARMAQEHPKYLRDPAPLLLAASRDLREMAELLLDLGMSPDVADPTNFRPLHATTDNDSVRVGTLLIERGAQIDPLETRFGSPPLGWAIHRKKPGMMAKLGAVSRHLRSLCRLGNVARLRELFVEEPGLAKTVDERGSLFFFLPEDEDLALETAELLLASGADPRVTNREGTTAVEAAELEGLHAVADLLATARRRLQRGTRKS